MDLKGRSLLKLLDYTPAEIEFILASAAQYKQLKKHGTLHREHEGKSIALLFEKTSTRTRCAFEVAAADLGIAPTFLGKDDIQLGKKESLEDTAKVLGRMYDGIEFRGFKQQDVEDLAKFSQVPVWNGLTDEFHPTQVLADFLTIQEHVGKLKGTKLVFVGDGTDNVSNSLMVGAAKMGMHYVIATPNTLQPPVDLLETATQMATENGGSIEVSDDLATAVSGADVIYTDIWVSMGQEDLIAERISQLKPYQVNMDMIKATNNPDVFFMHCLPAFHDTNTDFAQMVHEKYGLTEMEVTDEVFRSQHSIVFDQAENRLHTIKAVIALTI
ncbi:ornithine carbamoyltransferase [Candidatus Saccharibacteria bacterium]|nr:ornithine carbamoyltransferase [Candidatus Saccharibacteria bacterium]